MSGTQVAPLWPRKVSANLRTLPYFVGVGAFLAAIGAFDTDGAVFGMRLVYWESIMIAAWAIDAALRHVVESKGAGRSPVARSAARAFMLAVAVTPLVWVISGVLFGATLSPARLLMLFPGVVLVSVALGVLLHWRQAPPQRHEAARGVPSKFLSRLPFPLRRERLLALQSEDHYLRVHTSGGSALIRMKFSEAVSLLGPNLGFQCHRSWWVAREAVHDVSWSRGTGVLNLGGDVEAPVSRRYAKQVVEALDA